MDNLWIEMRFEGLKKLSNEIKREIWFVHSKNPDYSARIKKPLFIDFPLDITIFSEDFNVTAYRNGRTIDSYKVPADAVLNTLNEIGRRISDNYGR